MNKRHTTAPPDPAAEGSLGRQRKAIAALGHELRLLVDATVRTAASPETLHHLADGVCTLTRELTGRRHAPTEIPEVDEFPGGVRMYSPVTGAGSALAPPMRVTPVDGGVVGRCLLGSAHEGPPGYGHGGVSGTLLDELMGWACAAAGKPGMTIALQMRYQGPVPLEPPASDCPRRRSRRAQDLRARRDHHRRGPRHHPGGGGRSLCRARCRALLLPSDHDRHRTAGAGEPPNPQRLPCPGHGPDRPDRGRGAASPTSVSTAFFDVPLRELPGHVQRLGASPGGQPLNHLPVQLGLACRLRHLPL